MASGTPPDVSQRRLWDRLTADCPSFLYLALFYAGYVLAAGFGQWLAIIPDIGITLWPPSGLFIATLILNPKRSWPCWVAAGFLAETTCNLFWFHNPLYVAVPIYVGNALEAMIGAWLVGRFCKRPVQLDTINEILALSLFGAAIAPVASATIGSATLAWFGLQPFTVAWPLWWIGDATGVLLIAPLTIVLVQDWRDLVRVSVARVVEACLLALVFLGACALSLGGYLPFAYIIMPPLLWAAVRFEFKGAAVLLVMLAVMTAVFTVTGVSQFTGDPETQKQHHVMMQLFLAISAFSALVVAAVSRQHQQALLRLKRLNAELESRVAERTATLRESELQLRLAQEAAELGTWENNFVSGKYLWTAQVRDLIGVGPDDPASLDLLMSRVHPDDRGAIEAEITGIRQLRQDRPYRREFRVIRPGGAVRWLEDQGRVEYGENGHAGRAVGILRDVTDRKTYEQQAQFLAREVNHRAKNILSLVQAIARQTAASSPVDFVPRFLKRLHALAASQDMLINSGWKGAELRDLIGTLLAHFKDLIGERIILEGPTLRIKASASQALGLAIHELATNAGKYGALSGDDGIVTVAWSVGQGRSGESIFAISWVERGGPPVTPPGRRGFGTTVIETMTKLSLQADVAFDFKPDGLSWRLECPAAQVLEERAAAQAAALPGRSTARVLVVEDEAVAALDVASELEGAGYKIVGPAANVEQAMRLLAQQGCDAAVLDINLGPETSAPVAARLIELGVPFVALSGSTLEERPPIFRNAPFLAKPMDCAQLIDVLARFTVAPPAASAG